MKGVELHMKYSINKVIKGTQWSMAMPKAKILLPPATFGLCSNIGPARKAQKKIEMTISLMREN